MGEFRSDIAEESRRLRGHLGPGAEKQLVDNMLAEDAYRHDYETMPPRDSGIPEMSVMDTTFMSPETHDILGYQSHERARDRQLESENQPLIPDYPEDYIAGGAGLFQLGKGLTKAGLKYIAKQQARKHRLGYTRNVLRPQAQFERRVRHNDMNRKWGLVDEGADFRNPNWRRTDPSTLRRAHKKYKDEGQLAEDVYGDPYNDAEAFDDHGLEIDQEFDMFATRAEMDLLEGTDALGKVMGRDRPVGNWIDEIEWPRLNAQTRREEQLRMFRGGTPGGRIRGGPPKVRGGHEGYSELPKYWDKREGSFVEWFLRGGGRPSANSIIPAAVLHESMTE